MLQLLKYTALIAFFRAYKSRIYAFLLVVAGLFLLDYIYDDIRSYLEATHTEYLCMALLIKSGIVISLFLLLIFLLIPKRSKNASDISPKPDTLSEEDERIIREVKEKTLLADSSLSLISDSGPSQKGNCATDQVAINEMIIEETRNKKKLETRAEKILKELSSKN